MPWALVTGASAGLGEAFARALAAEGYDLLLTARRADRLEALWHELSPRVRVHTVPLDLARPEGPAELMAAAARLGIEVDLLVNNAGYGLRGSFAGSDAAGQLGMVDLNCRSLTALAHAVVPGMVARGTGGILNVASTAAFQPGPWMAVYYASKAFVLSFSQALHEEVRGKGVRVAALCPGPVRTEFGERSGLDEVALFDRLAADPADVVRDGLAAVRRNRAVAFSGVLNRVAAEATRLVPRGLLRRTVGTVQRARTA